MTKIKVGDIVQIVKKQHLFVNMPIGTKLEVLETDSDSIYYPNSTSLVVRLVNDCKRTGQFQRRYLIDANWVKRGDEVKEQVTFT